MMASTKRACLEGALNAQETAYLEALGAVRWYAATGNRLVLRDSANAALLEFIHAPAQ